MVEETNPSEDHGHSILIASRGDLCVLHTSTGLDDGGNSNLGGMVDGITEREEGIGAHGNSGGGLHELVLLGLGQGLRDRSELSLPANLLLGSEITLDVANSGIDPILTLDALLKLERKDLGVLTKVPGADLASRELDAVNTALLSSTNADHHTILGKADGVTLSVLDADRGHDHVANGALGQVLVGSHGLLHVLLGDDDIISLLREGHTIDLTVLNGTGIISRSGLENDELTTLLLLKDLKSGGSVAGRDDTIAHLLLEDEGSVLIDFVGNGGKITKGAHGIGIAGTEVGKSNGGELGGSIGGNLVRGTLNIREGDGNGSSGRTDVLEGGGGGKAGGLAKLLHQLPGVGRIQKIDVTGNAIEDREGELAVQDGGDGRRLLLGVASVLEGELGLVNTGHDGTLLSELSGEPRGDGRIVGSGQGEGPGGETLAQGQGGTTLLLHNLLHLLVLVGAGDDGGEGVVLGSRTEHGGAANVNVLNALLELGTLGNGGLEGVEVEDGHVDLADAVLLHLLLVLGVATDAEEAAMDLGVERLDASVEALGRSGVVRNINDGKTSLAKLLGGAAGREQLHILGGEEGGKLDDASLIRHRDESPGDGDDVGLGA